MDRRHVPDRAARRHRPRRADLHRPAGRRRRLAADRPEDLHYLGRPRRGRQHLPPGHRPHARRAARGQGHQPVPDHQVRGEGRRQLGRPQRLPPCVHRAQAGHPRLAHVHHGLRGRQGRAGRRAGPGPGPHVRHDERRAPAGRRPGRGHRRASLPAGPELLPGPEAGPPRLRRRPGDDLRPPGRAPHADAVQGQDRSRPRHLPDRWRPVRPG